MSDYKRAARIIREWLNEPGDYDEKISLALNDLEQEQFIEKSAYDSLVESLILAKKQRDEWNVKANKLEAELAKLKLSGKRINPVILERDRFKAALDRIEQASWVNCRACKNSSEYAYDIARQALDGGNVAECICGEINARNCPVHQ